QVCHVTHSIHFFVLTPRPSCSSLFPYTTLFRSLDLMYSTSLQMVNDVFNGFIAEDTKLAAKVFKLDETLNSINRNASSTVTELIDRKSTRLNSSHVSISYAVFCLKKKKNIDKS